MQDPKVPIDIIKQPVISENILEVSAIGNTPLKYQWVVGEKRLIDADNYEGASTSRLVIKKASLQDEGCYHCEVKDEEDNVAKSATIGKMNKINKTALYEIFFVVDLFLIKLREEGLRDSEIKKIKGMLVIHSSLCD